MSKVQLQGNASGTGIFTIASPNSNTDRTLTLPDNTGTLLTSGSSLTRTQMPAGSVIQVVQTFDTFQATTSSGSFGDLTSVSITPTSATNKVLVRFLAHVEMSSSSTCGIRLQRNGTNIGLGSGGSVSKIILSQGYGGVNGSNMCYEFLDSPGTTSAITYKIQWAVDGSTAYYNRGVTNTGAFYLDASTLTALEVVA